MFALSIIIRLLTSSFVIAIVLFSLTCIAVDAIRPPPVESLESFTFEDWAKRYGKSYESEREKAKRGKIFADNLAKILKHNANPLKTWTMNVNHMADWTHEEFMRLNRARVKAMSGLDPKKYFPHREEISSSVGLNLSIEGNKNKGSSLHVHLCKGPSCKNIGKKGKAKGQANKDNLPLSVDYRNSVPAVLTAVKSQGSCGSCWAHAATESMESMYAIAHGQLYALSQEEINSCTPNPNECGGTGGCNGATAELAFEYAINAGGVAQEWSYPYTAYQGVAGTCYNVNGSHGPVVARFKGYVKMPANDASALLNAVANVGPPSISVDASNWQFYDNGIFNGCPYDKNIDIDHNVQLVGYGFDPYLNLKYWIVRNSWSPSWGDYGYIRILREDKTYCGTDATPSHGFGCKGGPPTLNVCGMCGILSDSAYPIPEDSN